MAKGLQVYKNPSTWTVTSGTEYKLFEMNGTYWMGYYTIAVMCYHGSNSGGFWEAFLSGYGGCSVTKKYGNANVTMRVAQVSTGKYGVYVTTNYNGNLSIAVTHFAAGGNSISSAYLSY